MILERKHKHTKCMFKFEYIYYETIAKLKINHFGSINRICVNLLLNLLYVLIFLVVHLSITGILL